MTPHWDFESHTATEVRLSFQFGQFLPDSAHHSAGASAHLRYTSTTLFQSLHVLQTLILFDCLRCRGLNPNTGSISFPFCVYHLCTARVSLTMPAEVSSNPSGQWFRSLTSLTPVAEFVPAGRTEGKWEMGSQGEGRG